MTQSDSDFVSRQGSQQLGSLQLGVAAQGNLRWAVVDVTAPLESMRQALDLSPVAAVALGRAVAAAALVLRFSSKGPSQLLFEVLGDGPLGKIIADVDFEGRLRGLVGNPQLAAEGDQGLSIQWAIGQGTLRVTQESDRGRYSSQVELVSGELGNDLVHFLEQSQQIRSAALLGVLPVKAGIGAAGGLLIEAFPGVPEETLVQLESNIAGLGGVSAYLSAGGAEALRDAVLTGFDCEELERYPLRHSCRCRRESLLAPIQRLPSEEIDALVDEQGRIAAACAFCGTRYEISRDDLAVN